MPPKMSQLAHGISIQWFIHPNPFQSIGPVNPMAISPNAQQPTVDLCPASLWRRCSDLRHKPRGWATSRVPSPLSVSPSVSPCVRSQFLIGWISIVFLIGSLCDHFLFFAGSWFLTSAGGDRRPAWLCQSPGRRTSAAHRIPGSDGDLSDNFPEDFRVTRLDNKRCKCPIVQCQGWI